MTNETAVTQSPLEAALLQIINTTTQAVGKGIDFLSEQIPDVIHQLLLWHASKSAVIALLWLSVAAIMLTVSWKLWQHGKQYVATHYDNEEKGFSYFFSAVMALLTILPMMGAVGYGLTVLKILIAPKIFLIEYAAQLMGK